MFASNELAITPVPNLQPTAECPEPRLQEIRVASKMNMKRRRDEYEEADTSADKRQCRRDVDMSKTLLACPFAKYDPIESHRCCRMAFENIARLKEHLRRTHLQPPSCPRCFKQFNSRKDLKTHARASEQCKVQEAPPACEGLWLTEEADEKLSRRTRKGGDRAETWVEIYTTIFPKVCGDDIPSPFFDNRSDSIRLREHIMHDFTRYLRGRLDVSKLNSSKSLRPIEDSVVLERLIELANDYATDSECTATVDHDTVSSVDSETSSCLTEHSSLWTLPQIRQGPSDARKHDYGRFPLQSSLPTYATYNASDINFRVDSYAPRNYYWPLYEPEKASEPSKPLADLDDYFDFGTCWP